MSLRLIPMNRHKTLGPDDKPLLWYRRWQNMIRRCHYPSCSNYQHYGGKGVTVCDRWRLSADTFLDDMGEPVEGQVLILAKGSTQYSKQTCRWGSLKEVAALRRKRGAKHGSLRQRAAAAGISYSAVYRRVRSGWPVDLALSTPITERGKRLTLMFERVTYVARQTTRGPRINKESIRQRALASGLKPEVVYARLRLGWPLTRALKSESLQDGTSN